MKWLIGLIAVNLVMSFTFPGVSWQGHIGGLITGAVVAAAFVYAPQSRRVLVAAGSSVAILALFLVLIAWRTTAILDLFTAVRGGTGS